LKQDNFQAGVEQAPKKIKFGDLSQREMQEESGTGGSTGATQRVRRE
jgi:hypothetical protein